MTGEVDAFIAEFWASYTAWITSHPVLYSVLQHNVFTCVLACATSAARDMAVAVPLYKANI